MIAASSLRRLGAAHWPFLAVCAVFLLVGALVVDEYGTSVDGLEQRNIGNAVLDYVEGGGGGERL